jgi:adenylate kinase
VPEFDEDMVVDFLEEKMCKGGVILDFHSSGFFPERVANY